MTSTIYRKVQINGHAEPETNTPSALTLSDTEFDLKVDGGGNHRLCEDQDVLQANHHHQVRKNLPADRKPQNY